MKKYLKAITAVFLTALILCSCSKSEYIFEKEELADNELAVVSFNCAAPWGNSLKGTGSGARVKRFAQYMNTIKADSIGTQEMNSDWLSRLAELMPEYDSYGVKRGGDDNEKKSEMNAVFWLKEKYDCIDKGTFWLSETPDEESRYDGAGCNRVCTYVLLKNKENGTEYLHLNTHLDNASDEARTFGARVIIDKLCELLDKYGEMAVVLTGDFNDTIDSPPYLEITSAPLMDTIGLAGATDIHSTYTDWGKLSDDAQPIDFIFTNCNAKDYRVLDDVSNNYISDHYGVYSVIEL